MNIFVLDTDVIKCARYHVDKHVVKMILETTQLLNNALSQHSVEYMPVYNKTHVRHPCSIWAAESLDNFDWLNKLGLSLCDEYTFRYKRRHKCQSILEYFSNTQLRNSIPSVSMTPFKLCMPNQYKTDDAVKSYRLLYKNGKNHLAKWSKRGQPDWWDEIPVNELVE
jgi:hypothetical protein